VALNSCQSIVIVMNLFEISLRKLLVKILALTKFFLYFLIKNLSLKSY